MRAALTAIALCGLGCVDLSYPHSVNVARSGLDARAADRPPGVGTAPTDAGEAGAPGVAPDRAADLAPASDGADDVTAVPGEDAVTDLPAEAAPPDATSDPPSTISRDLAPDLPPDLSPDRSPDVFPDLPPDLPPDTPPPPGAPALLWRFDEATGSTAADSSGNGFHGTYFGDSGLPRSSAIVPTVNFLNPASLVFTGSGRQGVRLSPLPVALRPAVALTISVWYRSGQTDVAGGELVSGGDNYVLRLQTAHVQFSRRIGGLPGVWRQCRLPVTTHLDGAWHHVAGVNDAAGLKVFFDGQVVSCPAIAGETIVYDRGTELVVGRHADPAGLNHALFDFDGQIDDVRIYTRALSDAEITALARGQP